MQLQGARQEHPSGDAAPDRVGFVVSEVRAGGVSDQHKQLFKIAIGLGRKSGVGAGPLPFRTWVAGNPHQFLGDLVRRQDKIDQAGRNCTSGHRRVFS